MFHMKEKQGKGSLPALVSKASRSESFVGTHPPASPGRPHTSSLAFTGGPAAEAPSDVPQQRVKRMLPAMSKAGERTAATGRRYPTSPDFAPTLRSKPTRAVPILES